MSDSKKKTINVTDPLWCDTQISDGHFVLEVHSSKHCIRLHFKRHWIESLAGIFWKVVRREAEQIEKVKEGLRGE